MLLIDSDELFWSGQAALHLPRIDGNTTKINHLPSVVVPAMTTKRSLPILALTLALAIGYVGLAHAPPPSSGPTIATPVISPLSPSSSSVVTISIIVTSAHSTVKNVTITYTFNNWKSNTTAVATYNATTTTATSQIPALASGGVVYYYVVAFDTAGNKNMNNNNGIYFSYLVPGPTASTFTLTYILVATGIAAAIGAVAFMILKSPQTKSKSSKSTQTQNQN